MEFYGIFIPVPVTGNGTSKSGKVPFFRDILYFRQSKSKYMIQHQRIIVDTLLTILEQINFVIDNAGID